METRAKRPTRRDERTPGARELAFQILRRVEEGGAYSDVLLHETLSRRPDLPERERALTTELVYGCLRRRLSLDYLINRAADQGIGSLPENFARLLRLGSYQLFFLDRVPARAAVDETVSLAKAEGFERLAGAANAILRKLAREAERRGKKIVPPRGLP
ncbi:MAG: transcription antitermination factor NusB, partial [Vicinamibacteria bacterium]